MSSTWNGSATCITLTIQILFLFLVLHSIAGQELQWELILSAVHVFPRPSDLALLCKYQLWASCLLYFSKASATLLTFIYICCQRITFLSYERLSRPACLNVVTHKFIIRTPGTRLKGPICDLNVNKRVAPQPSTFKEEIGIYFHPKINKYIVHQNHKKRYIFILNPRGNSGNR